MTARENLRARKRRRLRNEAWALRTYPERYRYWLKRRFSYRHVLKAFSQPNPFWDAIRSIPRA